ncbi:hypothetical protein [uncultured Pseudomonas sp.]|uniref:hypothetical protein n=1 Tax=uncultured Pseudomonas sp. TaxID=114707 RepID=UPI0025E9FE01|nr:hypothetical protein [uncultured Pseudomonas sp.]
MNKQVELEQREARRRAALRNLYSPDLAASHAALSELRDVLEQDRTSPLGEAAGMSIDDLRARVPVHTPPEFPPYIRREDMPEPWKTRFWAAACGSITMSGPGIYAHDWDNFLYLWEKEHRDLAERLLAL